MFTLIVLANRCVKDNFQCTLLLMQEKGQRNWVTQPCCAKVVLMDDASNAKFLREMIKFR